MKLKNRKTGEIVELKLIQVNDKNLEEHEVDLLNGEKLTLKLLADSFDDVKDPLIKDEKIRKAVRAWAEANNIRAVYYSPEEDGFYVKNFDDEIVTSRYFADKPMEEDGYGEHYTIDELCGEEE